MNPETHITINILMTQDRLMPLRKTGIYPRANYDSEKEH